jgi:hypothetical protein
VTIHVITVTIASTAVITEAPMTVMTKMRKTVTINRIAHPTVRTKVITMDIAAINHTVHPIVSMIRVTTRNLKKYVTTNHIAAVIVLMVVTTIVAVITRRIRQAIVHMKAVTMAIMRRTTKFTCGRASCQSFRRSPG